MWGTSPLPLSSCVSVTLGRSLHFSEPHRGLSHLPCLSLPPPPPPTLAHPQPLTRMAALPSFALQRLQGSPPRGSGQAPLWLL